MINTILMFLKSQPKFKTTVESLTGQPIEHVANCFAGFIQQIGQGPGVQRTAEQKNATFQRLYNGGRSMGFADWEAELCAAILSGFQPMDVCISFRQRRNWNDATVERINKLAEAVMPRFLEAGKKCGLIPPEAFPENTIPQTEINTAGGVAPWNQNMPTNGATAVSE